ncbi:MAG: hypothetical protein WCJ66_11945 [Verrucomicrobiota bacterium]
MNAGDTCRRQRSCATTRNHDLPTYRSLLAHSRSNTRFCNNTILIGPQQNLPKISFNQWEDGKANNTCFSSNSMIVAHGGGATYHLAVGTHTRFTDSLLVGRHVGLPDGARAAAPVLPGGEPVPQGKCCHLL